MATLESSGTQTATVATEHTLTTITSTGTYMLLVDVANMALGDTLELRVKTKVLSGGTSRVIYKGTCKHAQSIDDAIKSSIPVPSDQEIVFTLKQTAGTGRDFPWKVMSL